jgi:hypothetical protein
LARHGGKRGSNEFIPEFLSTEHATGTGFSFEPLGDSLGHMLCVALRPIIALERGQAGNGQRAVASRA